LESDERFDVVLLGFAEDLPEPPAVGLERVFGVDGKTAMQLLVRLPRTVQKNVPRVRAEYFRRALTLIGASVEVRTRGGRVVVPEPGAATEPDAPRAGGTRDDRILAAHAPTQLAHPAPVIEAAPATAAPSRASAPTLAWGNASGAPNQEARAPAPVHLPAQPTVLQGAPTRDAPVATPAHEPSVAPPSREPSVAPPSSSFASESPASPHAIPSPIPPEFALPAATLLAPLPPRPVGAAPAPGLSSGTMHAAVAPFGGIGDPALERPRPLFGPSSKTVVDTSNALGGPVPGATFAGLSLPPPLSDSAIPPFEPARPPSRAPGPIDGPEGLDWLKLASSFGTQLQAPSPSAQGTPSTAAAPDVAVDRFVPLNPEAFEKLKPPPDTQALRASRKAAAPGSPNAPPRSRTETLLGRALPDARPDTARGADSPRKPAPAQPDAPRPGATHANDAMGGFARPGAVGIAHRSAAVAEPPRPSTSIDTRTFWSTIGEAVGLPFQGHGLYWMLGITIWALAVGIFAIVAGFFPMPVVAIIVTLIAQSSVLAFACDFFKVCTWVPTTGEKVIDRSPQFEPEKILYTYILSGLHLMAFSIVSLLPLGFWAYKNISLATLADPNALLAFGLHPVTWLLAILPGLYWPMGVGLTALANDFASVWNVPLALKGIARAPMAYLAIVVVGWLAFFAIWIALALFGSSMGLSGTLLQAGGGFPLAASHGIMGAMFGHLVRARPDLFD
jgi:hypothetical protein